MTRVTGTKEDWVALAQYGSFEATSKPPPMRPLTPRIAIVQTRPDPALLHLLSLKALLSQPGNDRSSLGCTRQCAMTQNGWEINRKTWTNGGESKVES